MADHSAHQTSIGGVCMMSNEWKNEQHPSFIEFIDSFLSTNAFRLNIVSIAPDFIFNCGGVSVAFVFVTDWHCEDASLIYGRVHKLKEQFAHLNVVLTLPTKEQNHSFVCSYLKSGFNIGRPVFIPVLDLEMGFEKIVMIAHAHGVCKQSDFVTSMKAKREQDVHGMDAFLRSVTSIPGINNHDANSVSELSQAIGSIEAIAKASKEYLLENTDLSADKAEAIVKFFREPKVYLRPKFD